MKKRWQVLVVPATLATALIASPSTTSTTAKVAPASELQMVAEGPGAVVAFHKAHCKKKVPGVCTLCAGICVP